MSEEETLKAEAELDAQKENIPSPDDNISRANNAAKRLEEATNKMKAENDRAEAMRVHRTLGGKTETRVEQKEETPEEYAKRALANDL